MMDMRKIWCAFSDGDGFLERNKDGLKTRGGSNHPFDTNLDGSG